MTAGLPAGLRRAVLWRDGSTCQVCRSTDHPQVDHRDPRSRGGADHPANLWVLCRTCNYWKGSWTVAEWIGGGEGSRSAREAVDQLRAIRATVTAAEWMGALQTFKRMCSELPGRSLAAHVAPLL